MLDMNESIEYLKAKKSKARAQKVKKTRKTKMIKDGEMQYIKNLETGKLYGMPRTIVTRRIERNQLKSKWREYNKGVEKKYRISFSDYWQRYKEYKNRELK